MPCRGAFSVVTLLTSTSCRGVARVAARVPRSDGAHVQHLLQRVLPRCRFRTATTVHERRHAARIVELRVGHTHTTFAPAVLYKGVYHESSSRGALLLITGTSLSRPYAVSHFSNTVARSSLISGLDLEITRARFVWMSSVILPLGILILLALFDLMAWSVSLILLPHPPSWSPSLRGSLQLLLC